MGRQAARNCTLAIGESENKCKVKDPALANNGLGRSTLRFVHAANVLPGPLAVWRQA